VSFNAILCIEKIQRALSTMSETKFESVTFANGCFWCTEAVFLRLNGVEQVTSGYIGGHVENPSYRAVCGGDTGHAEAVQILFDSAIITFTELLEVFFATHDPTTLNRQGNDVGTQYRSGIFYHNEKQKKEAQEFIALLEKEKIFASPIVTEISSATVFYSAEKEHENYYNRNPDQGYCRVVINPKIEKLNTYFRKKLKDQN